MRLGNNVKHVDFFLLTEIIVISQNFTSLNIVISSWFFLSTKL